MKQAAHLSLSLVIPFLFPLLLSAGACSNETGKQKGEEIENTSPPPRVHVVQAKADMYRPKVTVPGTIISAEQVTVAAPLEAKVKKLFADEGERVKQGETLARLETGELERELLRLETRLETKRREIEHRKYSIAEAGEEAERTWNRAMRMELQYRQSLTELSEAKKDYEEQAEMYESGGISRSILETSEKRVEHAEFELGRSELALKEALIGLGIESSTFIRKGDMQSGDQPPEGPLANERRMSNYLSAEREKHLAFLHIAEAEKGEIEIAASAIEELLLKASVTAPISGVVRKSYAERGSYVQKGNSMFIIYDPEKLRIRAFLGESFADLVDVGARSRIFLPDSNEKLRGEVAAVAAEIDSSNKSFRVEIRIPPADNRPGRDSHLLIPGRYLRVEVRTGKPVPAVRIPSDALLRPFDRTNAAIFTFHPTERATEGTVRRVPVEIHHIREEQAYVSGGDDPVFGPGSLVCIAVPSGLRDGMKVTRGGQQ